ncbi:MAG: hypothetical protein Q8K86_08325 [Candidatus Nanopelagicaceae bacterium]|nr:hypothetical protein [Candidatus Nanopelagicaceae bacterium]
MALRKTLTFTPEQILTWLDRHFDAKRSGDKQARINNPFDADDQDRHLWISLYPTKAKKSDKIDHWVHDFRPGMEECNTSFIRFVMKYRKCSYPLAVKEVGGKLVAVRTKKEEKQEPPKPRVVLPAGAELIDGTSPHQDIVRRHLRKRGFFLREIQPYRLHCTVDSIIFPYYEFDELVYWQSRSALGKTFRFPGDTNKSDYLFGYDFCDPEEDVGITEACYGAMVLGPGVTSSSGASLTEGILPKLRVLKPKRVILCPDNDEAGRASLRTSFSLLKDWFEVWYVLPPRVRRPNGEYSKDWADLTHEMREDVRRFYRDNLRRVTIAELLRPYVAGRLFGGQR